MSLTGGGEEVDELLDRAEEALDQNQPEQALELCDRALRLDPQHPGAWFVRGDALRALSQVQEAAAAYRKATLTRPDHSPSWSAYALGAFEALQFGEAQKAVSRSLQLDPRNAEAWVVRSYLLEWQGRRAPSRRSLLHARWLDPEACPLPPTLAEAEVEDLVNEAVAQLPEELQHHLQNVAILLEEMPAEEVLRAYDPPASPLDLLGHFSGHTLQSRSVDNPWSQLPPTIMLYRGNLQRHAADRPELIEELRITLFHEIGHFLGLDEEDLQKRGLD